MTESQIQRVVDLSMSGYSQRAIAAETGYARSTIQYHLSRLATRVSDSQIRPVVVLPDPHVPKQDPRTDAAVRSYITDNAWAEWVCLGDLNDFDAINYHTRSQIRKIYGKTIRRQYDASNDYLDLHAAAVNGAKMTLIEGNHDFWIERYIDEFPQLEGSLEVSTELRLEERGINWVRSWSKGATHRIGHATFIHGEYTNKYHAAKTVQAYGTNVIYGHAHDVQSHAVERKGDNATVMGQSLGCLCLYDQDYMRNKPNRWQQAFGVYYFLPNGYFTQYVVRIFDHQFVAPNGKVYAG